MLRVQEAGGLAAVEAELAEYRGLIDGDVDASWRELKARAEKAEAENERLRNELQRIAECDRKPKAAIVRKAVDEFGAKLDRKPIFHSTFEALERLLKKRRARRLGSAKDSNEGESGMGTLTFRCDEKLEGEVRRIAKREGKTTTDVLTEALR